jgi:hypothetical protein
VPIFKFLSAKYYVELNKLLFLTLFKTNKVKWCNVICNNRRYRSSKNFGNVYSLLAYSSETQNSLYCYSRYEYGCIQVISSSSSSSLSFSHGVHNLTSSENPLGLPSSLIISCCLQHFLHMLACKHLCPCKSFLTTSMARLSHLLSVFPLQWVGKGHSEGCISISKVPFLLLLFFLPLSHHNYV